MDMEESTLRVTIERWRLVRPFVAAGATAVVLGGLLAAVTGPLAIARGSWAAAYLVLVIGVAQIAFGVGRTWLSVEPTRSSNRRWVELATWNIGSLAVLVGSLLGEMWLVATGALTLLVSLGSWAGYAWGRRSEQRAAATAYLLFVAFLAASVLVGLGLSAARAWGHSSG